MANLAEACKLCSYALAQGHKIMLAGNGGSAADAQHIAAEWVVRYKEDRQALPALALTTDTSILTAAANDFSYEDVFSRQIAALGQPGDVFIAISTSGKSANIIKAIGQAKQQGVQVIALCGKSGMHGVQADISLCVPAEETARIQECHILAGHILCEYVDAVIKSKEQAGA